MAASSHLTAETDVLIAGGGLAGGLIALALAQRRPDVRVTIVEAGATLGGNHVWSFFDGDADADGRALVAPLVCHSWPAYDVAFPAYRRTIAAGYNSIESERFDAVVRAALPADRVIAGTAIAALDPAGAVLADGRRIAARGVIDARGFRDTAMLHLGWQKFVGRLLRLARPHGLRRPIVMDATVDQSEGYRFVYLLPFGPDTVFVEDTYYATDAALDIARIESRIADYAAQHGWVVENVERQEAAALPIAMDGDIAALLGPADGVAKAGMAAAMFHPMTGYSLPDAIRTAQMVAAATDLSTPALHVMLRERATRLWRERAHYRLLARMLFRAAAPAERYRMLQHFYTRDEAVVGRFYAGRATALDKVRILCGRPPVPLAAAARVLMGAA